MLEGLTDGSLLQAVWGLPAALLTVLIALGVFTPAVRWLREKRFAIPETEGSDPPTSRAAIARGLGLPDVASLTTTLGPLVDALYRPANNVHEKANHHQRSYHNRAARCVICLTVALITLGLSLTVYSDWKAFKVYASAIDVFALLITFQQWLAALGANHRWVATRTKAELLRQWTFMTALANWNKPENAMASAQALFAAKEQDIENNVVQDRQRVWWRRLLGFFLKKRFPSTTIEDRITTYWTKSWDEHVQTLAGLPWSRWGGSRRRSSSSRLSCSITATR